MFVITTQDDKVITGDECHWHELPVAVAVKSIGSQLAFQDGDTSLQITDDVFSGFDRYGFQMYEIHSPENGAVGRGLQFLCVDSDADRFLLVDINLMTGQRRSQWKRMGEMTYNRSLLRRGV